MQPAMPPMAAGLERMAEHGHVAASGALRAVVNRSGLHLDVHAERRQCHLKCLPDPGLGGPGGAQQHTEDQPAADHDLLHVDDRRVDPGPGVEQARRHRRPVAAGHGDEQRAGCGRGADHRC